MDIHVDLYAMLELDFGAPEIKVKAAYRRLAAQYHPDKVPGMENKFQDIQTAYKILTNSDRRERYHRTGRYDDIKVTPRVIQDMVEKIMLGVILAETPDGFTDDPTWEDIRKKILNTIREGRREVQKNLNSARKKLKRLDNLAKRFKSKTDADPVGDAFAAHRRRLLTDVYKFEDGLELNYKTEEVFEQYDYQIGDVGPEPEGQFSPGPTARLRGPLFLTDQGIRRG